MFTYKMSFLQMSFFFFQSLSKQQQGANQAFVNIVLALCDTTDSVVLFPPYYFNHKMALQMSIQPNNIILGERDDNKIPGRIYIIYFTDPNTASIDTY